MCAPAAASLRAALIALNADPDLPREAICRLARRPARWTGAPGDPSDTAGVRVRPEHVDRARRIARGAASAAAAEERLARRLGASLLTLADEGYPRALLDLDLPPPVLYLRGRLPHRPAVAIVGSRQADPYALEAAELFGRELAAHGLAVVSGFARGVDTAAHRGALMAPDGLTVAVLGCGLDVDYPRGNRRLAAEIGQRGAVVSEFPCGFAPLPMNFPIRNRIIAALAVGTLVVRAAPRSGSLITARLALDLGRDVYAVPGGMFDRLAAGTNALIQDGALLALAPRDILESLPDSVRADLPAAPGVDGATGVVSRQARTLLGHLRASPPASGDELARLSGLPIQAVQTLLLELELAGLARRYPGPAFCRRAPPGGRAC